MGILVTILVFAVIAGAVWWNKQTAAKALEGVVFVVPHPPSVVAGAIQRAHNQGAMAKLAGAFTGVAVTHIGPSSFGTSTRNGDEGEISVAPDPVGSRVHARALNLYVGLPRRQLNTASNGIWGLSVLLSHRIYSLLGVTPTAAKFKRWQNGLEGRINRAIARATSQ